MANITAIPGISYSNTSILIFPTSYTLKAKLFAASYPITDNEFGHTAITAFLVNMVTTQFEACTAGSEGIFLLSPSAALWAVPHQ